ncbi:MAG: hypothetical protein Q8O30_13485 [Candidatus Omnitrophota bacterium]|nr:hypothetical protein [Candidatus Omnitrophota bacterium]
MSKKWKTPKIKEVAVKEDSTSGDCQGKMIGCHAGSSCGSVKIKGQAQLKRKRQK